MADKDGGPAFPTPVLAEQYTDMRGLSLRDYFAAAALTGMLASDPGEHSRGPDDVNHAGWANNAYRFADAMLAARQPGGETT